MGVVVSSPCIVSAVPTSSPSSSVPVWGLSHGRQSFMNCSYVDPSHRCKSFTNCFILDPFHKTQPFSSGLLQCGSQMEPQVLLAKMFHSKLLYSEDCRSYEEPASVWALHGLQLSSGHICQLCYRVFLKLQGGFFLTLLPAALGQHLLSFLKCYQ